MSAPRSLILNHGIVNQQHQPEHRNNINKELLSTLLGLISPYKFENIRPEALSQLQKDIHELSEMKKISLNTESVTNKICQVCKEFFTKPLSCGCFLCSHFISQLENSIQEILYSSAEDLIQILSLITCPRCGADIKESDIERLLPEYRNKKNEIRLFKLKQIIQTTGRFTCESCKNVRGIDCLPDQNILSCQHMCILCLCKNYLETKKLSCDHCDAIADMNALSFELRSCHLCRNNQYIFGDRMTESSPGHLLCMACMLDSINKGYCPISNKLYSFQEKREYYQYVYVQCHKCGIDIFQNTAKKLNCCKKIYCVECTGSGVCPQCRVPVNHD